MFHFYFNKNSFGIFKGAFPVIIPLLISGLSYTRLSFITGIVYIIGRELYSQGYRRSGSKGRLYGALTFDLALLVLWSMNLYTCWHWGKWFKWIIKINLFKINFMEHF